MPQIQSAASGRKSRRRRLALTSALNNPENFSENANATASTPHLLAEFNTVGQANESTSHAAALAVPLSPETIVGKKRKRRRVEVVSNDALLGVLPTSFSAVGLGSTSASVSASALTPLKGHAGPSSASSAKATAISGKEAANAIHQNVAPSSTPSIQQQLQERTKLLAERESNTKLEAQVQTLGKEVQFKNHLLSNHDETMQNLKQNFTCNICFELFRDPHAYVVLCSVLLPPFTQTLNRSLVLHRLAPCGHTACAPCLLEWFSSLNSLLHPPQHHEPADVLHYTKTRTKVCFTCRTPVIHKPIPSYIIKDTVHALSAQLRLQGTGTEVEAEEAPEIVSAAGREFMWDTVFKPVTNRSWFVDEDDGVRRCSTCGHEIEGRHCSHCNEHFSDLSDDEDSYGDYSEDESLIFRHPINQDGFLHARWPGEDSEEEDFSDEDIWPGVDYRHDGYAANHLRGARRPNVRYQPMDFEFGFQEGVLENGFGGDEPESDGASFIDDDDIGMERHFVRGYDYDGDDDDEDRHEEEEDERDGLGMDALDWSRLDRHGRPTQIHGRAVAYSPSVGSSHGTFHSVGSESMNEDAEPSAIEVTGSRGNGYSDNDTSAREDWGPVRRLNRFGRRHRSVDSLASINSSPAMSDAGSAEEIEQPRRRRRVVRIVSDED
ncbi:hypothetical protein QFC21_004288 [Naganishia friedmannii]|uniref:Uncharacterized protein n=1 Tax=Naganishia friedmannii TaxID=89922 RepID=A0ACC2VID2_9TREE|nr:hypothetical protein QFC21_004288 [Naganishia friedmannii]